MLQDFICNFTWFLVVSERQTLSTVTTCQSDFLFIFFFFPTVEHQFCQKLHTDHQRSLFSGKYYQILLDLLTIRPWRDHCVGQACDWIFFCHSVLLGTSSSGFIYFSPNDQNLLKLVNWANDIDVQYDILNQYCFKIIQWPLGVKSYPGCCSAPNSHSFSFNRVGRCNLYSLNLVQPTVRSLIIRAFSFWMGGRCEVKMCHTMKLLPFDLSKSSCDC